MRLLRQTVLKTSSSLRIHQQTKSGLSSCLKCQQVQSKSETNRGLHTTKAAFLAKPKSNEMDTALKSKGMTVLGAVEGLIGVPIDSKMERLSNQFEEFRKNDPSLVAAYFEPIRLPAKFGIPVCNLHMRSYDLGYVELMADFAMRAAFYLRLPASGPVPLPRRTERWTVIKSPFVHAKSKENFERITYKRLIQIKDADLDVVRMWLKYITENAVPTVGIKSHIFSYEEPDTEGIKVAELDANAKFVSEKLKDQKIYGF